MTQWQGHPAMRRPVQADDEYDDVWPLPIPRSARCYTPLKQEPQARSVLVVNRRRERQNRQVPASPIPPRASAYQQRQRGYTQQAAGLSQHQVRHIQDDPQYQLRPYRQAPTQDEALSQDEQQVPILEEEEEPIRRRRPRGHRLFYLGLGMLGMLLLWSSVGGACTRMTCTMGVRAPSRRTPWSGTTTRQITPATSSPSTSTD